MWRWFRWILLGLVLILVLFGLNIMWPFSYYLPHERPVLILPIEAKYDDRVGIMPMGERIEHANTPNGHPGIDFGFEIQANERIPYIASMDGEISSVKISENEEKANGKKSSVSKKVANVFIRSGSYQVAYTEMDGETLPENIKKGTRVKQGDIMGYGNLTQDASNSSLHQMIHWEFGSVSPLIDRFCPLTYFTADSLNRIEKMWPVETTDQGVMGQMVKQYPKICNGDYDGKNGR